MLLVEDNADAREMLRQVLAMNGHDVYEAADGASGVALAGAHDLDVAIIDIGLPDIDGHEVARRLRGGRNGHATLIALTGYGQPEDRQRALAADSTCTSSPVSLGRLDEAIAMPSQHSQQRVAPDALTLRRRGCHFGSLAGALVAVSAFSSGPPGTSNAPARRGLCAQVAVDVAAPMTASSGAMQFARI